MVGDKEEKATFKRTPFRIQVVICSFTTQISLKAHHKLSKYRTEKQKDKQITRQHDTAAEKDNAQYNWYQNHHTAFACQSNNSGRYSTPANKLPLCTKQSK